MRGRASPRSWGRPRSGTATSSLSRRRASASNGRATFNDSFEGTAGSRKQRQRSTLGQGARAAEGLNGAAPPWDRAVRAAGQAVCAGSWARQHLPLQRCLLRRHRASQPLPGGKRRPQQEQRGHAAQGDHGPASGQHALRGLQRL
eukprot:8483031-Pyramimonas_sp.AAC.1